MTMPSLTIREAFEPFNLDDLVDLDNPDIGMDSSTFMFQVMFPTEVLEKERKEIEDDNCSEQIFTKSKQSFNNSIKQAFVNQSFEHSTRDSKYRRKSTIVIVEKQVDLQLLVREIILKYVDDPILSDNIEDKNYVSLRFFVGSAFVEKLICELQKVGIGRVNGSSMSVLPLSVHFAPISEEQKKNVERMDKFYASIKSRNIMAEIVTRIREGAMFTFDFLLLLLLASIIAFVGLVENSSVILVASMLVSPLMGPILAGVFGAVIRDRHLTMKGIIHETQALLLCIFVGFILGLCICPVVQMIRLPEWPTQEMLSRGSPRALVVGVLVAIPSGAGIAISVLGGNSGSLVGVAISASLLPPAVNAGFFWALALVLAIAGEHSMAGFYALPGHNETILAYLPHYSTNLALESLALGLVSLILTLINIISITITGFGILRLKEVRPDESPERFFCREDAEEFPEVNNDAPGGEEYYRRLAREKTNCCEGLDGTFMQNMFERSTSRQEDGLFSLSQWMQLPRRKSSDVRSRGNSLADPSAGVLEFGAGNFLMKPPDTSYLTIPNILSEEFSRQRTPRLSMRKRLSDINCGDKKY